MGTLRFEAGFYHMRRTLFTTGPELPSLVRNMQPMFPAGSRACKKRGASGKYSLNRSARAEIFSFAVNEIRKYSDCPIALCKESAEVWRDAGLAPSRCSCVCQLDAADMSASG
ncbi:MAG: hypothetical protein KGY42_05235 [Desulfobacterales bacterium]|nr:hypothetical protein [Desulfobacterales bacterium]